MERYVTVLNHDRQECSVEPMVASEDLVRGTIALRGNGRKLEGVVGTFSCWQAAREHAEATNAEYHFLANCEDVLKEMETDPAR